MHEFPARAIFALTALLVLTLSAVANWAVEPDKPDEKTPADPPAKVRTIDELLLFFPARHPAGNWKPRDLKFEDAWFEAEDGIKLHGWYCPCDKPRATILIAHGNAGNIAYRAPLLRQLTTSFDSTFDFRSCACGGCIAGPQ